MYSPGIAHLYVPPVLLRLHPPATQKLCSSCCSTHTCFRRAHWHGPTTNCSHLQQPIGTSSMCLPQSCLTRSDVPHSTDNTASLSCRPCRGVLLFGPPGTGKTLLARAAAAECGASFLAIHPSTVASKWLGDGVRYMRAVFSLASKLSPCVLFIDEVDAMLAKRDSQREHEAHREIKNEFMAQWDGIRTGSSASIDRVGLNIQHTIC